MGSEAQDLVRLQQYDVDALERSKEFGEFGFSEILPPARKIRELARLVPSEILPELPNHSQQQLNEFFREALNQFDQVKKYRPIPNDQGRRDELIRNLKNLYNLNMHHCFAHILYAVQLKSGIVAVQEKLTDLFADFEQKNKGFFEFIEQKRAEVTTILEAVRDAAAESGVSQNAKYFKETADEHQASANKWLAITVAWSVFLVFIAFGSLFIHTWSVLDPKTDLHSYQLIAGKVLIFVVLTYMLFLFAKSYMSHRHNSVVNRHRQNALMTFRELSEAAGDSKLRSIILTHAASCIFSPQETGYAKGGGMPQLFGGKSVIELIQTVEKVNE